MSLLEYLVVGSYLYTTASFVYLLRLERNHLFHRIRRLEKWTKLPDDGDSLFDE